MDNKIFNVLQKAMSRQWVSLIYEGRQVIVKPLKWEGYNIFVLCQDGIHKRRLSYYLIQSPSLVPTGDTPSLSTKKHSHLSSRNKARYASRNKPTPNQLPAPLVNLVQSLGPEHEEWIKLLWDRFRIRTDVLISEEGELLAEPLFWFKNDNSRVMACFGHNAVSKVTLNLLEDSDIRIIAPGDSIPTSEG